MLPESNVELERSYQTKHKKIDKEVASKENGVSENNKQAVKKQIQHRRQYSRDKKWIMKEQTRYYQKKSTYLI